MANWDLSRWEPSSATWATPETRADHTTISSGIRQVDRRSIRTRTCPWSARPRLQAGLDEQRVGIDRAVDHRVAVRACGPVARDHVRVPFEVIVRDAALGVACVPDVTDHVPRLDGADRRVRVMVEVR